MTVKPKASQSADSICCGPWYIYQIPPVLTQAQPTILRAPGSPLPLLFKALMQIFAHVGTTAGVPWQPASAAERARAMVKCDRIAEAMWLEYQTVLQKQAHGWYIHALLLFFIWELHCFSFDLKTWEIFTFQHEYMTIAKNILKDVYETLESWFVIQTFLKLSHLSSMYISAALTSV
jgi:hypothetical protein